MNVDPVFAAVAAGGDTALGWWTLAATIVTAVLAAAVLMTTTRSATRQRTRQAESEHTRAQREQWWTRFTWATELALRDDDAHAYLGVRLLGRLIDSPLAGPDEAELAYVVFAEVAGVTDNDNTEEERP